MTEDLTKSNRTIASLLQKKKLMSKRCKFLVKRCQILLQSPGLRPVFRIKTESNVANMINDALDRGLLRYNYDTSDTLLWRVRLIWEKL